MQFDNKKQRGIVLQLIEAATFSGKSLDDMYEFKQAVRNAEMKVVRSGKFAPVSEDNEYGDSD